MENCPLLFMKAVGNKWNIRFCLQYFSTFLLKYFLSTCPYNSPLLDPCPIILIVDSAIVNFILSLTMGQMEVFELCIHLFRYDSGWELSHRWFWGWRGSSVTPQCLCSAGSLGVQAQLCQTLCCLPGSSVHGDSSGKNTRVGFHPLLQGIFPTQKSNPNFLRLLHCMWILYPLSYLESPISSLVANVPHGVVSCTNVLIQNTGCS